MTDEFFSLKLGLVTGAEAERSALLRAASQVSIPLVVAEIEDTATAESVCEWLHRENPDVLLLDSRMPHHARKSVVELARATDNQPILVMLARAEGRALDILVESTGADGLLTAPVDPVRTLALFEGCVRARCASRVLVVDDSSTVRSVVRKVLQASRFRLEVHEAADGDAALDRATSEHFDIVFLDCHMPGQDGFATLTSMRAVRPDIKVVMMTAADDDTMLDRARVGGAQDLLRKPFYAKDIDAVLNRLFGLLPARF